MTSGAASRCANTLTQAMDSLDSDIRNVVLDLMLPDGNGIELLKLIRALKLPVRVAVTTATYDPELIADIRTLHPDRIFQKPVPIMELLDWILF